MAVTPLWLVDKSALARLRHPTVAERLAPLFLNGLVATSPIIDLEVLYSARSYRHYQDILVERRSLPSFAINEEVADRAIQVQHMLAKRGQHRIPLPDLLIASVAEVNGLTVLHYDADFDRIAAVSNQPCEWVVPQSSM